MFVPLTSAMLKEKVADVISTDFSEGYHDPILLVFQKPFEVTVLRAIHLATGAVGKDRSSCCS